MKIQFENQAEADRFDATPQAHEHVQNLFAALGIPIVHDSLVDMVAGDTPALSVSADGKGYENTRPESAKPQHMPKQHPNTSDGQPNLSGL